MRKEWLLIPLSLVLLARILVIRPQLLELSRFQYEYSPWSNAPIFTGAKLPIFAVNGFPDREAVNLNPSKKPSFYRGHASRDGVSEETLSTEMYMNPIYPDLNVGEHSASKASPAVDETGIYVGGDTGWFFAFNLDRTLRWKFHIDAALRGIHSTALLYQNRVCIGGYNATFYCLNKSDGKVIWSSNIPNGGYGASPLVVDQDFITSVETNRPPNGFMARFSLEDGHVIWKSPYFGDQPHSSPALDVESGALYGGDNDYYFFRLDSKTGAISWRINLGAEVKGSPMVGPNAVYIASWSKRLYSLNKVGGTVYWIAELHGSSQSSPTLFDELNVIVIGDSVGYLYGINSETGKILWEKQTGFEVKSSALAARNQNGKWAAWIACGRDVVCAIEPETGKYLNQIKLPGSLTGAPVAFNGEIYLALNFPGGLVKLSPGHEAN